MKDSISRIAAIHAVCAFAIYRYEASQEELDAIRAVLNALPSAQPEQNRGEWIYDPSKMGGYKCSVCGKACSTFKYCPNCGARMEVR